MRRNDYKKSDLEYLKDKIGELSVSDLEEINAWVRTILDCRRDEKKAQKKP